MSPQELQVQQKRELQEKQEGTAPIRSFIPDADIYEREEELTVVLEVPGVERGNINISVEDGVLSIEGRIDSSKYKDLVPVYTEYSVGDYRRSFSLSSQIEQQKITADLSDGVLTITLPKAEQAKPRRIALT
jgi:HSP20 family molecular chaperone IbpA